MDPKTYSKRPDGLLDITLDNGQTTPVRLSEGQLQEMGYTPAGAGPGPAPVAMLPAGPGPAPMPPPPQEGGAGGAPSFGGAAPIAPTSVTQPTEQPGATPHATGIEPQTGIKRDATEGARPKPSELDQGGGGGRGFSLQRTPVRRIPGKDMRASWAVQPGQKVSDEVKSDLLADDRPEDTEARAAAIAGLRNEQQDAREAHLLEQREGLDTQRARRTEIDTQIQKKRELIDRRDKEAEAITPKSASDVMADRGVLAQLAAAISVAIGGYQQGLTGRGNNVGLDLVNQSIRSDIDKQREAYEQAKERGKEARNDYAQALELYGTPEAAEQDMEMRRLAIAEKMIENRGQQIGTQEYLQASHAAATEFRQQRAQTRMNLNDKESGRIVQENWVRTPDQFTGGQATLKPEVRERQVTLPDGSRGFVVDKAARQPIQERLTSGGDVLSAIGKLQRLAQDNTLTDLDRRAQYKALIADIAPVINVGKGQGAMSNDEFSRMTDLLGDPNAIFQSRGAALDVAAQGVRGRMQAAIRDNVYQDPDGMVPVAQGGIRSRSNL